MTIQTQMKIGNGICEHCGNGLTHDRVKGYMVCDTCGTVHDRIMVSSTYQAGGTIKQNKPPTTQFVSLGNRPNIVDGMGSYMGCHAKRRFFDASSRPLHPTNQAKFRRLKYKYEMSTKISANEPLFRSLIRLNRTCSILEISYSIRNEASYLLQKTMTLMKQKSPDMFINAVRLGCTCLVAVLRKRRAPFSDQQVLDVYIPNSRPRYLTKYKTWIQDNMDITFYEAAPFKKWIPKVISDLERSPVLTDRIETKGGNHAKFFKKLKKGIKIIADKLTPRDYVGKNPKILAVSLCYAVSRLICSKMPSQKLYGEITDTAEYSIRDHYANLWKPYFKKHPFTLT